MYDIFKPRFLQSSFAPRILIGVGGTGSTSIDTVARDAADAAQQSVDAITAQVGEVIATDQGVISSDGKQFVNATAQNIILTGISSAELLADGLTETTGGALSPNSVTATELADEAVSNQKLAAMAALSLKGNDSATTGAPKDIALSTVAGLMPIASSSNAGLMSSTDKLKSDNAGFHFGSVADMVASVDLVVGSIVDVAGYFQSGDGGGNRFEVVSAGTGSHDGGAIIDLAGSGLQAQGKFPQGYFLEQWGPVKDGVADDAPAIRAALAWCAASGVAKLRAFSGQGVFGVIGLIQMPENMVLDCSYSQMVPLSDDAGFNLRRNSGLENLKWDVSANATWLGPMMLCDAFTDSNIANYPRIENVSCKGYGGNADGSVNGTMFKLDASGGTRITGLRASGLYASNIESAVEFIASDGANGGYVNSNSFKFDMIFNCSRSFVMDRLSTDNEISMNYIKMSYQSGTATSEPVLKCNGWFNEFDFIVWDWNRGAAPIVIDFGSNSKLNAVSGTVESMAVKDASFSNYRNKIATRIIPVATLANTAAEPSSSNSGLFMGQVDNCLSYGNKRYSVTAPAVSSGSLNSAFQPNQNARPAWNSLTSLQIEIDLLSSKSNLRTIGVAFSDDSVPDWVQFERSTDGTNWTEVEYMPGSRITAWFGNTFTGSAFQYLRITMTTAASMDYKIVQIFGWWKNEEQGAYLPTGGGEIYGDTDFKLGNSVKFTSSNGVGTAGLNVDNSSRLQLAATGGVELNGVRILGDQQPAITDPSGGSVIDVECRAALIDLADRIRNHGLVGL